MTLYNKYRPTVLEQVIGNGPQMSMVRNLKEFPHVWLISGEGGTGKTTMARILASMVPVEEVKEINSSDATGVDDIREIIESMRYPVCTAYILDEAHKLSTNAQSALLKPLEDTPSYIYFFLCTTDPQKLSMPLRSRCTPLEMKPLNDEDMFSLLRSVTRNEGKKLDSWSYEAIVNLSDGSPRKALVLLESIINVDDPQVRLTILESEDSKSQIIDLCRILLDDKADWKYICEVVKALDTTNWESVRHAVLGYMASVLLSGARRRAAWVIENFREPFYDSGKAGLVLACYKSISKEQ